MFVAFINYDITNNIKVIIPLLSASFAFCKDQMKQYMRNFCVKYQVPSHKDKILYQYLANNSAISY